MCENLLVVSKADLKKVISEVLLEKEKADFYRRHFDKKEVCKLLNLSYYQLNYLIEKGKLRSEIKGKISGNSLYEYLKNL
jgi:transcriptional regulator with AAA-type ATPase domain